MGTEKRTSNRINENASSKVTGRENWRHQPWELRQMQSLSLGAKKRMTFDRIKGWYETFDENVYFSYSGGKDSTVLLEMVAVFCKEYGYTLYVAFCDTGLEYPEIRIFAEANAKRIASVYGKVVKDYQKIGQTNGQMSLADFGFAMDAIPLKTTGCDRTGCIFCGYGCHLDKGISRFQRLKETHEKLYNYCIGGGEFNERGMWQPSKRGLGMGFVFDWLNEQFGDDFIRYK